jgi:ArsR family transcriptional regulator, arsenate/arsenite/antimonite-responsive transcriptional repressor
MERGQGHAAQIGFGEDELEARALATSQEHSQKPADRLRPNGHIDVLRYDGPMNLELTAVTCCSTLDAEVLSSDEAEATAELFKALGDPARVRIVNVLATSREPVCICNLIEPLGLSQPTVSHHMKKLLDAGLVERAQNGKWAYFSLRRDAVEKLAVVADLKGACC